MSVMTTSRNGRLFIACREAIVEVPYADGPHLSIGCGFNSPDVKPTDRWTPQQALAHLKADVALREKDVNRWLGGTTILQQEFDALVSLHYNRGNRDFLEIMALVVRGVIRGETSAVAAMLLTFDTNSAGVHLPGLLTRRIAEQRMFLIGDYGPLGLIPWWRGDPHTTPRFEYVVQDGDL